MTTDRPRVLRLAFELVVFPWQTFKGSERVRRTMIARAAVLVVAVPAFAFVTGDVFVGVAGVVVCGGLLLFMTAAHRRLSAARGPARR
jgi:hypothetical protein